MRFAERAARAYLLAYGNYNYCLEANGEEHLLYRLSSASPKVIFDIGANVGDWTAAALSALPSAFIHCFEIVPSTANQLSTRFREFGRVRVNEFGLLDEAGTIAVKTYSANSTAASVNDFPHALPHAWIRAYAMTGDAYCAKFKIDHIDYLKIDAEGADHRVLMGFSKMFEEGRVSAVQFEYGLFAIQTRFLLLDFYEFFEKYDYLVGKVFPDGVDFKPYDLSKDETFIGPNYVAVQRDRPDLIDALRA